MTTHASVIPKAAEDKQSAPSAGVHQDKRGERCEECHQIGQGLVQVHVQAQACEDARPEIHEGVHAHKLLQQL
eukprot:CAMPEP_0175267494 /NCGR_PEP_ID=MMETSP0093-20121207/43871_1 /TAXON_ID=311494 /ORGANISM="Alexandrium monilatum, Strain CCMP3105" /LENGTH=72 /DNA_ID=CAMNT_0016562119 /DNA_START=556 /DNA_END=773 /DNA_ORIENTATION=-